MDNSAEKPPARFKRGRGAWASDFSILNMSRCHNYRKLYFIQKKVVLRFAFCIRYRCGLTAVSMVATVDEW